MTEIKLRPCPFCGEIPAIERISPPIHRTIENHEYCVACGTCDLMFGWDVDYGGRFDTEEEAAEAWNGRANDTAMRVKWSGWKGVRDTRYRCPSCGKAVRNDDIHCHTCGQKLMFPQVDWTPYVKGQKQEIIVKWEDEDA